MQQHNKRQRDEDVGDGPEAKKPTTPLSLALELEKAAMDDFERAYEDEEDTPGEPDELGTSATDISLGNALHGEPGSAADALANAPFSRQVVQNLTVDQISALKDEPQGGEPIDRIADAGFCQLAPVELALEATLSSQGESAHVVGVAQRLQISERAHATTVSVNELCERVLDCIRRNDRYLLFGSANDCYRQTYWHKVGTVRLQGATHGKATILCVTMSIGDLGQDDVPKTEAFFFDDSIVHLHPLVNARATRLSEKWTYPTHSQLLRLREDAGQVFGPDVAEAVHEANKLYAGVHRPDQPNLHTAIERIRVNSKIPPDVERLIPLLSAHITTDESQNPLAGKLSRGILYHEPLPQQRQPLSMARLHRCARASYEMLANTPLDNSSSLFFSGVCAGTVKHRDVQPETPCVFELLVSRHSTSQEEEAHRTIMIGPPAGKVVPIPAPASVSDRGTFAPIAAIIRSKYPKNLSTAFIHMQLGDTASSFYSIALIAHPKGHPHPFAINYTSVHRPNPVSSIVRSEVLSTVNPIGVVRMGIAARPSAIDGPLSPIAIPKEVFQFTCRLRTAPYIPKAIEREKSFREEHAAIIKRMSGLLVLVFDKMKEGEVIETLAKCHCTLYGDKNAARQVIRIVREDNKTQVKNLKKDNLKLLRDVSAAARLPRGKPPPSLIKFGGYDDEYDNNAA